MNYFFIVFLIYNCVKEKIMQDIVLELNTDNYDLKCYEDKIGNKIDFKVFFINDRESSHLSQLIVQAYIENEVAGYISLLYLSNENKDKYFSSVWDFYYHKKMPGYLKSLLKNDTQLFCTHVNQAFNIQVNTLQEFKNYTEKLFYNEYTKFISFHLNKPYPELVTVYSDSDKTSKDFSEIPFINIERPRINFLNKGIANAIHHAACAILKKQNMFLYASNNNTEDGKRLWKHLTKNPKFITLSDCYLGTLTQNREQLVQCTRHKITI